MSKELNQLTLIGHLECDPEIKYTTNNIAMTLFGIVNNTGFMLNNEHNDCVNYVDIVTCDNMAIACYKYLKKGNKVRVTGSIIQNKSKIEINADSVYYLGKQEYNDEMK